MTYSKERFNPQQGGFGAAFDGIVAWVLKQFFAIARAMPWAPHVDTRDFVTVSEGADVSAQLQQADRAALGGTLFLAPRIYRIASSLTLSCSALRAVAGAVLLPANGVLVTLDCDHIDAGPHFLLDTSGGGAFKYNKTRKIRGEWYIKYANGVDSDSPHLNALTRDIGANDDQGYVTVEFERRLTLALDATWDTNGLSTVELIGPPTQPGGVGIELRWIGPHDGKMISWNHTQNCRFKNFQVRPAWGALIGVGGHMVSGSPILTEVGFNQWTFGPPIPSRAAFVYDATGALVLSTTVAAVEVVTVANPGAAAGATTLPVNAIPVALPSGITLGFASGYAAVLTAAASAGATSLSVAALVHALATNDTSTFLKLNANAPSTLDTVRYKIGATATSGPAAVSFDWDMIGGGITTTECTWEDVLFRQDGPMFGHVHLRWSHTSVNNCENARVYRCHYTGGGTSPVYFSTVENGSSATTIAGDTLVTIVGGGTITPLLVGQRVRIAFAGGTAPDVEFDDVIKTYLSPTTFRTRGSVPLAVTGARMLIGEGQGEGIQNGVSSNALRHTAEYCTFTGLAAGTHLGSGSIGKRKSSNTNNEIDNWLETFTDPCEFDHEDSEAARQALVCGNRTVPQGGSTVRLTSCRMTPGRQKPHDGYIAFYNTTVYYTADGCALDLPPYSDATLYETSTVATLRLTSLNTQVTGTPPTMARMGYNSLGNDVSVHSKDEPISDAPHREFWKYGVAVTNIARGQINGFEALSAPSITVPDANIQNEQVVPFTQKLAGSSSRAARRYRDDNANLSSSFDYPNDVVDLVDGAIVGTPGSGAGVFNARFGGYFALQAAASPRAFPNPINPAQGQPIAIQIWNNSGGPLVVTWGGVFKESGTYVPPANTKVNVSHWRYYKVFAQWIFEGQGPDI